MNPLLQAILDDPQDRNRVLVYADWLEEQGDPAAPMWRTGICERENPDYGGKSFPLDPRCWLVSHDQHECPLFRGRVVQLIGGLWLEHPCGYHPDLDWVAVFWIDTPHDLFLSGLRGVQKKHLVPLGELPWLT